MEGVRSMNELHYPTWMQRCERHCNTAIPGADWEADDERLLAGMEPVTANFIRGQVAEDRRISGLITEAQGKGIKGAEAVADYVVERTDLRDADRQEFAITSFRGPGISTTARTTRRRANEQAARAQGHQVAARPPRVV